MIRDFLWHLKLLNSGKLDLMLNKMTEMMIANIRFFEQIVRNDDGLKSVLNIC